MNRMALLLVAAAGCATDGGDPVAGDAALNTSAQVNLTRTICRGMTTTSSERPRCAVPEVGPDNPPMITCWRYYRGTWTSEPAAGVELAAGSVTCSTTFMGESWAIVVVSGPAT
jgi:hypothetical protein